MAEPQGRSRVSFQRANRIEGFDEEDQPEEQVTPSSSRSGGPSMAERALANATANRMAGQARLDAADERRRNEPVRETPQASPENEARLRAALSARREMEEDIAASRAPTPLRSIATRTYPPILSESARDFHEGLRQGSAATARGNNSSVPTPVSAPAEAGLPAAPASAPPAPARPSTAPTPAAPRDVPPAPSAPAPSPPNSQSKTPPTQRPRKTPSPDQEIANERRRRAAIRAAARPNTRMSARDTSSDELNEIFQSVSSRRGGAEMEPGRTGDIARRIAAREAELSPMKRGGPVKKMAKGGVVKSSASSRSDGCITKGRTKGRVV